jgi:hypothetical protein
MMYDMSVAFGASNFRTSLPSARLVNVPLMPGSTSQTARPASSTRYRPAGPPASSVLCHTRRSRLSPPLCASAGRSRLPGSVLGSTLSPAGATLAAGT